MEAVPYRSETKGQGRAAGYHVKGTAHARPLLPTKKALLAKSWNWRGEIVPLNSPTLESVGGALHSKHRAGVFQ